MNEWMAMVENTLEVLLLSEPQGDSYVTVSITLSS